MQIGNADAKEDARQTALLRRKEAIVINAENNNINEQAKEKVLQERIEEENNTLEMGHNMGLEVLQQLHLPSWET